IVAAGCGPILPARQDDHIAGDHLGAVAILTSLLVLPLVGAQAALDIHARALGQVLITDLAQLIPGDAADPFSLFVWRPVGRFPRAARGDAEGRHSAALRS